MLRPAYGYTSLPLLEAPDSEVRLRPHLVDYAVLEGLELRSVFVDQRGEQPCAFSAMREQLRCGAVHAVLVPDLTHVAHIATVAHRSPAGLARYLGAAVLLATTTSRTPAGRP